MSLIDLTAEFVKQLNLFIRSINMNDEQLMHRVADLRKRIASVIERTANAEARAVVQLGKLINTNPTADGVVYVRKDGLLKAVISMSVAKPVVGRTEQVETGCSCTSPGFGLFGAPKGYVYVESEAALFEADQTFSEVCIQVLDHDYRSFDGFSCYLAVRTPDGLLYVIDAIKYREAIPRLNLLRCGVLKLVHCRRCVKRLVSDFGDIGCYRNYDVPEKDVYVDWRIRPISDVMTEVISEDIAEMVEKLNLGITTEKFVAEHEDELKCFVERFGLPSKCPFLSELLKLRAYLAKTFDEGVQYVMTDAQLLTVLEHTPTTVEAFSHVLPRMSSVARLHAGDFLIVLNKRAKVFSIERLKMKTGEESAAGGRAEDHEKYKNFRRRSTGAEESSELQISSA